MRLAAEIKYLSDALGGQDRVKLGNSYGDSDGASLEIYLEAEVV
jgi:hypothetical protein